MEMRWRWRISSVSGNSDEYQVTVMEAEVASVGQCTSAAYPHWLPVAAPVNLSMALRDLAHDLV